MTVKKRKENRQQQRNKIELCKERKTEMRWKANKEFPFKKFDGNIARKIQVKINKNTSNLD